MVKNIFWLHYAVFGLPPSSKEKIPIHYKKNGIVVQNVSESFVCFYDDLITQEIFYKIEAPNLGSLPEQPACEGVESVHTRSTLIRAKYKQYLFDEITKLYGRSQGTRHLTRRSADLNQPFELSKTQATLATSERTTKANVVSTESPTTSKQPQQESTTVVATGQPAEFEDFGNEIDYMKDRFRMSSTKEKYDLNIEKGEKEFIMDLKPAPEYLCEENHLYFELRIRTLRPMHKLRILLDRRIEFPISPKIFRILKGPDSTRYWKESSKDVSIINSKCEVTKYDNMNSTLSIICPNNEERLPQEMKIGISFTNATDCSNTKIYQIHLELHKERTEIKERNRRQALVLGGLMASGLLGAFGTHFVDKAINSKKYNEIELMVENENLEIQDIRGMVQALNNESHLLQQEYISSLCTTNQEEYKLSLKLLAENVAQIYVDHVNMILFGASLPNSKVKQLASGICKNMNKGTNAAQDCLKFYEIPEFMPQITNYGTVSEEYFKKNVGETFVWIKASFRVPQLARHSASIHRITSIPIPVGSENEEYKYKRYEVPTEMAYVQKAARKISLQDCEQEIFDTIFCNLRNFNEISREDNLCLNSIFSDDPQCFETNVYSSSNCLFRKIDQTIYVSHQGPASSLNDPKTFSKNAIFLNNGKNQIKGTGIYSFNFSDPVSISCEKSEFHFEPNYDSKSTLIDYDYTNESVPEFLLQDFKLLNKQFLDLDLNKNKMSGFFKKYISAESNSTHHNFWTNRNTHLSFGITIILLFNTLISLYYFCDCTYYRLKYTCRKGKVYPGNGEKPISVKYSKKAKDQTVEITED